MGTSKREQLPPDLVRGRSRFQAWRGRRKPGGRIPHALWAMAARLADKIAGLPGLQITRPVQTNAVFATLPAQACAALQERFAFYVWDERLGEVRWMCSWDPTEEDVDQFAEAVGEALA